VEPRAFDEHWLATEEEVRTPSELTPATDAVLLADPLGPTAPSVWALRGPVAVRKTPIAGPAGGTTIEGSDADTFPPAGGRVTVGVGPETRVPPKGWTSTCSPKALPLTAVTPVPPALAVAAMANSDAAAVTTATNGDNRRNLRSERRFPLAMRDSFARYPAFVSSCD